MRRRTKTINLVLFSESVRAKQSQSQRGFLSVRYKIRDVSQMQCKVTVAVTIAHMPCDF